MAKNVPTPIDMLWALGIICLSSRSYETKTVANSSNFCEAKKVGRYKLLTIVTLLDHDWNCSMLFITRTASWLLLFINRTIKEDRITTWINSRGASRTIWPAIKVFDRSEYGEDIVVPFYVMGNFHCFHCNRSFSSHKNWDNSMRREGLFIIMAYATSSPSHSFNGLVSHYFLTILNLAYFFHSFVDRHLNVINELLGKDKRLGWPMQSWAHTRTRYCHRHYWLRAWVHDFCAQFFINVFLDTKDVKRFRFLTTFIKCVKVRRSWLSNWATLFHQLLCTTPVATKWLQVCWFCIYHQNYDGI